MASKKNKTQEEPLITRPPIVDASSLRTRKRVVLEFPPSVVQTPITYMLAKEYDIASNILRAEIAPEESGKLVIEMTGDRKSTRLNSSHRL